MISDLVDFIQAAYPPTDGLPQLSDTSRGNDVADAGQVEAGRRWPPDFPGIDRPALPPWLIPGEADPVDEDTIASLEEQPIASRQQRPPNPDVLAYYLPFHFYEMSWGIYIRASGTVALSSMLAAASGGPAAEFLDLAYQILLQHERFHFFSEVACSRAEIASRSPLYRSYFGHRRAAALEEALANAHSVRIALRGQPVIVHHATESWMRSQGPGYRDFGDWVTRGSFARGRGLAAETMIDYGPGAGAVGPAEFLYDALSRSHAPTYVLHDTPALGTFKPFPKYQGVRILVHTNDHPPPHVHLESADGRPIARLQWPSLEPVKGDRLLSSAEKSIVESYLDRYGMEIGERVKRVYGAAA